MIVWVLMVLLLLIIGVFFYRLALDCLIRIIHLLTVVLFVEWTVHIIACQNLWWSHFSSSFTSSLISCKWAYGNHIRSNTHEYWLIETTMILLYLALKAHCMNILQNICIQVLFCVISFVPFCFNMIWLTQSVFEASRKWRHCHTVMCVDWLCRWHNHVADVVPPSSPLAFVTEISEGHRFTSLRAVQLKHWWKTVGTKKKLDIISLLAVGERIVDVCPDVRCAYSSVCTVCGNAVELQKVIA